MPIDKNRVYIELKIWVSPLEEEVEGPLREGGCVGSASWWYLKDGIFPDYAREILENDMKSYIFNQEDSLDLQREEE